VLLVDDEELVRASTADMLRDLGYTVLEANSARAALQRLDDGLRPDVLVTDHLMPGQTGPELARDVRLRFPHIHVLIISGFAELDAVEADLVRLTKPFRQADLARKLAELAG
jgi:CheY-like chemotaxis protein